MTPDPLGALLVGLMIVAVLLAVFWPGRGLLGRWRKLRRLSHREAMEDALKHLFKAALAQRALTLHGLAGALRHTVEQTVALVADMEQRGLVVWQEDHLALTPEGHDYALHIIRAHRLWERYLADRTGFDETEWHDQAERYEHTLTRDEVRALAARLGQPTHDPHGDPIPGAGGQLVRHGGVPLTRQQAGAVVRIVHLEDEPPFVYAQLVAEGLAPGMRVRVIDKTAQRVRFWADGDEHVLAPVLANNVSVVPAADPAPVELQGTHRLSELAPGESGRVVRLSRKCRGAERRRLLDLGLTPGTVVTAELEGPGDGLTGFRIRGALIALRRMQSRMVHIKKVPETEEHYDAAALV